MNHNYSTRVLEFCPVNDGFLDEKIMCVAALPGMHTVFVHGTGIHRKIFYHMITMLHGVSLRHCGSAVRVSHSGERNQTNTPRIKSLTEDERLIRTLCRCTKL